MNAYQSYLVRCEKHHRFPLSEQEFVDTLEEAYAFHKSLYVFLDSKKNGGGVISVVIPKHAERLVKKISELDRKLEY